jgi:hypothetical protein
MTKKIKPVKIMDVGIPVAQLTGKNLHPEIIKEAKEILFTALKRTYANRNIALVGKPKYKVAESDDGHTYVGIKHAAHEV